MIKNLKEHIEREIAFIELLIREHNNKRRLEDIKLRLKFLRGELGE